MPGRFSASTPSMISLGPLKLEEVPGLRSDSMNGRFSGPVIEYTETGFKGPILSIAQK
jgi:hypothetical protein